MQFLRLIAILALPLALAACGGDAAKPAADAASSAASGSATATRAAAPASADAIKPLVGTWATDTAQCTGPVLKISEKRFESGTSGCDITALTDNGNGSFNAQLSCAANGQTATENVTMRPIFGPGGEGIDLTYVGQANKASTVYRCQ